MVTAWDSGCKREIARFPALFSTKSTKGHGDTGTTLSISESPRPRGFVPIGVFFVFGAVMSAYAAITLLVPGTFMDALWALNPRAHAELAKLGHWAAAPFCVLSPALCLAAIGWFRRRRWGWTLGVTILAINMAGDLGQIFFGERWKGVVGVAIAAALLFYLTRPALRNYFVPPSNKT